MAWLLAKLAPVLVDTVLDYLLTELKGELTKRRVIARHGAKLGAAFKHLREAKTDDEWQRAARETIGASWE